MSDEERHTLMDPRLVEHRKVHHAGRCDCPCLYMASLAPANIATVVVPDSLDAAWAEAEALLPEGHGSGGLAQVFVLSLSGSARLGYTAEAHDTEQSDDPGQLAYDDSSPAAALRALAARLRDQP